MILTSEQAKEVTGTEPVHVVNPHTQAAYVLLSTETYQQLRASATTAKASATIRALPAAVQQAKDAFLRHLPGFLAVKTNFRQWVAFQGDRCVAQAASQCEVLRQCQELGLGINEVYAGMVVPHEPEPALVDLSLLETVDVPSV